ncbi:MAG TPA: RNA polymerase subunit sigma, partial [Planctomycetaceae bacterium]|nr:RNA polymerase subunit sigma [Planctomycetaceae bacterium]
LVWDAIDNLLDFLDEREAYIIVRRFGICRQVKHSLKQIADLMDISKERVRQLEQRALNKLRARAISTGLQDELLLEFA